MSHTAFPWAGDESHGANLTMTLSFFYNKTCGTEQRTSVFPHDAFVIFMGFDVFEWDDGTAEELTWRGSTFADLEMSRELTGQEVSFRALIWAKDMAKRAGLILMRWEVLCKDGWCVTVGARHISQGAEILPKRENI